jgi:diketogulonate reductase-like aldo/keto reductase
MTAHDTLRYAKIPLTHGSGTIPALGFGTLIPDPLATEQATKTALEVGFRHFVSEQDDGQSRHAL